MSNGEKGIHAIEKNNKNQENKKNSPPKISGQTIFLDGQIGRNLRFHFFPFGSIVSKSTKLIRYDDYAYLVEVAFRAKSTGERRFRNRLIFKHAVAAVDEIGKGVKLTSSNEDNTPRINKGLPKKKGLQDDFLKRNIGKKLNIHLMPMTNKQVMQIKLLQYDAFTLLVEFDATDDGNKKIKLKRLLPKHSIACIDEM
ncbi:hypothetical protein P5495_021950 [Bacillus velezensis]|uniref:hypothetical protein n=1 Tax=Bacillus velezensis TaxID=492670 RepID=UPI003CF47A5D